MALVHIPSKNEYLHSQEEINSFLRNYGITYEYWQSKQLDPGASEEDILAAYENEIEKLKIKGSYHSADVIDLSPTTPGLDEKLARFSREHTHSEDEVRYCISGRGIFHINPQDAPVFSIELEAGDLINVPTGTRHWFNLCQDKTIQVIRLFQDKTGWTPHYMEDNVDVQYAALCFSEMKQTTKTQKTVVNS
jgi:1,2-dihydroxy-3-keto-5-methylthiopentene dioxygenase